MSSRDNKIFSISIEDQKIQRISIKTKPFTVCNENINSNKISIINPHLKSAHIVLKALINNSIVTKRIRWIFGNGTLVVGGSLISNEKYDTLWLLLAIAEQARLLGGEVHYLISNTDINYINEDWILKHPKYCKVKGVGTTNSFYGGNLYLWQWLIAQGLMKRLGNYIFFNQSHILNPSLQNIHSVNEAFIEFCKKSIKHGKTKIPLHTTIKQTEVLSKSKNPSSTVASNFKPDLFYLRDQSDVVFLDNDLANLESRIDLAFTKVTIDKK